MSWNSMHRLCRHCGGVTTSKRDWCSGSQISSIDKCCHCGAPLTSEDDYDTYRLPPAHAESREQRVPMKTATQIAIAFFLAGSGITAYIGFIVWGLTSHG